MGGAGSWSCCSQACSDLVRGSGDLLRTNITPRGRVQKAAVFQEEDTRPHETGLRHLPQGLRIHSEKEGVTWEQEGCSERLPARGMP